MLGYITPKKEELKVKDFDKYRGFYCGVCYDLKKRCGELARLTLTYDMTFLAILLSSLYDSETTEEKKFCPINPIGKRRVIRNEYTAYAADMSLIMTYHNLMDDWIDDKNVLSYSEALALKRAYKKAAKRYDRQINAVESYLKALHEVEAKKSKELDKAASLTGEFFKEVFIYDVTDPFSKDLGEMGFYLGKFIYLMDAYEDVTKDIEKGSYNPFAFYIEREDFDVYARDILIMMAKEAAFALGRLPVTDNTDILNNILYAGIWNKYEQIKNKKETK